MEQKKQSWTMTNVMQACFFFTIYLLHSSTCFEHYMLIIRKAELNLCSIWYRPVSQWPSGEQVGREMRFSPNLSTGRPLTVRTIPDAASKHFSLLMMSI